MTYRHPSVSRPRRSPSTTRRTAGSSSRYGAAWFDKEHRALGHPVPGDAASGSTAFEEAVQVLRGLLTTDGFTFEGQHVQVQRRDAPAASGAGAAPPDLDRCVRRAADDADRGALRRRVALLRTGRGAARQVGADLAARRGGRPRPGRDPPRRVALARRRPRRHRPHHRHVARRRVRVPRVRLAVAQGRARVEEFAAPVLRA